MSMENVRRNNMSRNSNGHEAHLRQQPLIQKASSMRVQPTTIRQKSVRFNLGANEEFYVRRSYSTTMRKRMVQRMMGSIRVKVQTLLRFISGSRGRKHGGEGNGIGRHNQARKTEEIQRDQCHDNINEEIGRGSQESRGSKDGGDEERNQRQRREEEEEEEKEEGDGGQGEYQMSIDEAPMVNGTYYHHQETLPFNNCYDQPGDHHWFNIQLWMQAHIAPCVAHPRQQSHHLRHGII
ncbi:hypothetical protein M0R45_028340 [Rubus argutus]|uniref:Uncharacterized protein n=1 Tax=Rubus argutus TaxID=59490 RepID=A0AAW1W718_RUBAR